MFVHGSLFDHRYWAKELTHFSKDFRAIAMSRRHHWPKVAKGQFNYCAQTQIDDVIAFIEQLDCGPVHLVGHSYGGYIAAQIACIKPTLLLSLTLVEPGGPVEGQVTSTSRSDDFNLAADMILKGDVAKGVAHFMDAVCAGREWLEGSEEYRSMTLSNATTITEQVKEARACITVSELARIRVPVLLMLGELSHSPFPETFERLFDVIPKAERVVIPDASHLVNVDNYVDFCKMLDRFLAKI